MRINSLELTNFRQHVSSKLEFDNGLIGIIGPNGAGKSTILEAIAWALYGQPAARGNKDSIRYVRAGARASVRVELDFELGGHRYRVVRGLNSAELYLDGGQDAIANSLTSVSDLLQRRLGMTRTEFFHTYFTGQKELNVMSTMGPAERSQFLSRVLGYEKLRLAQDLVRDKRRELSATLIGLRSGMPDPEAVRLGVTQSAGRHADAERAEWQASEALKAALLRRSEIDPGWIAAQEKRDRHAAVSSELRVAENELTARQRDLDRIGQDLQAIAVARDELKRVSAELSSLAPLEEEYAQLEELHRQEGRRNALSDAARALSDDLRTLHERRDRSAAAARDEEAIARGLEECRKAMHEAHQALDAMRTEWVRDRQEAETKRDALRAQFADLKTQRDRIVDLGEDGKCPTCTRPLGENLRTVVDQLDEQMDTITVDGRYFSTRIAQLEQMPADVQRLDRQWRDLQRESEEQARHLARVQADVQELAVLQRDITARELRQQQIASELAAIPTGYDPVRHEVLERERRKMLTLHEQATRLETVLEREAPLSGERQASDAALAHLRGRIAELNGTLASLGHSEADYAVQREQQEQATVAAGAAELAFASASAELRAAVRAKESAERDAAELERTQELEAQLLRDRRLHEELERAYTDLRTDLNHALRPELSELASAFLAELTDHRYSELELDDQYNIVVLEDGRPKPVISGGEEDLANLVLRLAISQMIADRAGQHFSLLVLDEVFGSLDEVRRHNVVELLRRLQDRFEQVILITHIEAVRDGLDRVIMVTYDEDKGCADVRVTDGVPDLELLPGSLFEGAGA